MITQSAFYRRELGVSRKILELSELKNIKKKKQFPNRLSHNSYTFDLG